MELFSSHNVLSERELHARQEIYYDDYYKTINIEAKCMSLIARTMTAPVGVRYVNELSNPAFQERQADIAKITNAILNAADQLDQACIEGALLADPAEQARFAQSRLRKAVTQCRVHIDNLERVVPMDKWPMARYQNLLFDGQE